MNDLPEIRAEIDERGRMTYHATGAAVLLSKDEQDEILRKFADLQAENAKLRKAIEAILQCGGITKRDKGCDACPMYDKVKEDAWAGDWCGIKQFLRELGVEVGA